jgi:hypothetical protein
MVILAIAFALCGSALSTNASAAGGVLEGGRVTAYATAHRSDRVRQSHERGYEWQPQARSGYEWDPSAQAPTTQYPSSLNYGG